MGFRVNARIQLEKRLEISAKERFKLTSLIEAKGGVLENLEMDYKARRGAYVSGIQLHGNIECVEGVSYRFRVGGNLGLEA